MRLLIVDDSKAVHAFIKDALSSGTFEVTDAYDGEEALKVLQSSEPFALILLDWEMPRLSGLETLKALRARGVGTPVCMVTSLNTTDKITAALEAGATDYVMKPFTRDILIEKVQALTGEDAA